MAAPHPDTVPLVRQQVRRMLTGSPAFQQLDPDRRRELAHDLVNVAQYLVDAGGETSDLPLVATLADTPPPDTAGAEFAGQGGAVAATAGGEQYQRLVRQVDFPNFVAGLIDGVFNAIVTSSIKQMEAYAELVKNVSKTADAYMRDNITENQARDYLAERYPDHLEVDISGETPRVRPREGADEEHLPDFFADLGLSMPVDSLDEDTGEEVLMPAARRRMAMDRQQLLLTMVLMGLNRLVVTDGSIKATCMFSLAATDRVTQTDTRTTDFDRTSKTESRSSWWSGWFSPSWKDTTTSTFKVTTHDENESEAQVEIKSKLTGDVNLRFRSETFPLERMVDILGVERPSAPVRQGQPGAQPGGAGG